MRIVLVGYGKMGRAIESLAKTFSNVEIVKIIDQKNCNEIHQLSPQEVDVIVEFTHQEAFLNQLGELLNVGVPIVTGTTGWYDQMEWVKDQVFHRQGTLLYGSNFSVGANLLFLITEALGSYLTRLPETLFDLLIRETHHRMKKDAPSGTAIRLAQLLQNALQRPWTTETTLKNTDHFQVSASRIGMEKGFHEIWLQSEFEELKLSHRVFSRETFAKGALLAASWILELPPGMYEFFTVFKEKLGRMGE